MINTKKNSEVSSEFSFCVSKHVEPHGGDDCAEWRVAHKNCVRSTPYRGSRRRFSGDAQTSARRSLAQHIY